MRPEKPAVPIESRIRRHDLKLAPIIGQPVPWPLTKNAQQAAVDTSPSDCDRRIVCRPGSSGSTIGGVSYTRHRIPRSKFAACPPGTGSARPHQPPAVAHLVRLIGAIDEIGPQRHRPGRGQLAAAAATGRTAPGSARWSGSDSPGPSPSRRGWRPSPCSRTAVGLAGTAADQVGVGARLGQEQRRVLVDDQHRPRRRTRPAASAGWPGRLPATGRNGSRPSPAAAGPPAD